MIRAILTFTIALTALAVPAIAKDDGGFGDARFTASAPSALVGDTNRSTPVVAPSPSEIEPAAGIDEADSAVPMVPVMNAQETPVTNDRDEGLYSE